MQPGSAGCAGAAASTACFQQSYPQILLMKVALSAGVSICDACSHTAVGRWPRAPLCVDSERSQSATRV